VLLKKVTRDIMILPNGADVAAFDNTITNLEAPPEDLKDIPHPRLGWVGSLHAEVDYSLIFELASRRPAWNFVLIGQVTTHVNARADAERIQCDSLPNVHFLGSKRIDEIPRYLAHMDVNLMIYRLSDHSWIKAIYPLKLHEYLAVGHPVVSANVPSVRPFSKVVRIADGTDDWQLAISEALEGGGPGITAPIC
jgi:glycosyltransferase involved in cell wall biosynthesis